jgi:hypothetical protein
VPIRARGQTQWYSMYICTLWEIKILIAKDDFPGSICKHLHFKESYLNPCSSAAIVKRKFFQGSELDKTK